MGIYGTVQYNPYRKLENTRIIKIVLLGALVGYNVGKIKRVNSRGNGIESVKLAITYMDC